jgi:protein-S-isoprenylcysteine O-methyltransferase Ste14
VDVGEINRIMLVVFTILYYLLALALPVWRIRLRTGKSAFTFDRIGDPTSRMIGRAMSVAFVLIPIWSLLCSGLGPPRLGVWDTPAWVTVLGWACLTSGIPLVVLAQTTMGTSFRIGIAPERTDLVTRGPYRFVRHPIFSGILLCALGVVLMTPCGWTIMGVYNLWMLVSIQTSIEEQHLLLMNGEPYADYMRQVGRFLPGCGRSEGSARSW